MIACVTVDMLSPDVGSNHDGIAAATLTVSEAALRSNDIASCVQLRIDSTAAAQYARIVERMSDDIGVHVSEGSATDTPLELQ